MNPSKNIVCENPTLSSEQKCKIRTGKRNTCQPTLTETPASAPVEKKATPQEAPKVQEKAPPVAASPKTPEKPKEKPPPEQPKEKPPPEQPKGKPPPEQPNEKPPPEKPKPTETGDVMILVEPPIYRRNCLWITPPPASAFKEYLDSFPKPMLKKK